METNHINKLIMSSYPNFRDLPKGVKRMLLASETFFFDETPTKPVRDAAQNVFAMPVTVAMSQTATGSMHAARFTPPSVTSRRISDYLPVN